MKVSVCMATYNGAKYIKEQVDSILNQKFKENSDVELELIVSDDNSTDNTIEILKSYNDDRIKIFHHRKKYKHKYNKAAFACTENFGYALSKATGDYIFLADQDDVWYPWKIDKTLTMLINYGGLCATAFYVGGVGLKRIGKVIYKKEPRFRLKRKYLLYGFCCGFTKEILKIVQPMPDIPHHDNFIMLVASFCNKVRFINEPCAIHRWSGEHNVSSIIDDSPWAVRQYYRIKMILFVIWRCLLKRS